MAVSDRVLVLRHGRLVGERATADTDRHELARLMVGAEIAPPAVPAVPAGPALLALAGVSTPTGRPGLRAVDLVLARRADHRARRRLRQRPGGARRARRRDGRAGGGPDGAVSARRSGRTGRRAPRSPGGVARIPEDRHRTGSIGAMSLAENAILEGYRAAAVQPARLDRLARRRPAFAEGIIRDYDVRGGGPESAHRRCSRAATCRS